MPIWCRPISTMKVAELSRMMSTKNEQNNKKKGREKNHRSGGKLSFKKRQFVTGDEEETVSCVRSWKFRLWKRPINQHFMTEQSMIFGIV